MFYSGPEIVWYNVPDIVEAHRLIRQSNLPNIMKLRILVQPQLEKVSQQLLGPTIN